MRSGKRKNHAAFYGAVVAVIGALASGCKTDSCELQHWTIEVSLINGSYPSSFWLQSQERNPSALSWWHTPSFESISDTIHSENGQLTIDSFTNQGNNEVSMDVRLMNALGRKVFECKMDHGDSKTVNVEAFANGWYALEISSHHQAPQIFQLLIQHP